MTVVAVVSHGPDAVEFIFKDAVGELRNRVLGRDADSALAALADRATYFYNAEGRYWYDLQANISRRAKDQAERVHPEEVYAEIRTRLDSQRGALGAFAGVVVAPEETADIADVDEARLVILHPKLTHRRNGGGSPALEFTKNVTERRGAANRTFRNMLVYLAPDEARMEELENAVRDYLAWSWILGREKELDLTGNQRDQATDRRTPGERDDGRPAGDRLPVGARAEWPADRGICDQGGGRPGGVARGAREPPPRQRRHPHRPARRRGDPPPAEHDRREAVGGRTPHCRRPVAPLRGVPVHAKVRDRRVLDAGLTGPQPLLWEDEGFALADGYDDATGRYRGLVLPSDNVPVAVTNETLVVRPDRAMAQRETAVQSEPVGSDGDPGDGPGPGPGPEPVPPGRPAGRTRFFGSKQLQADRYASDFKKLWPTRSSRPSRPPPASR